MKIRKIVVYNNDRYEGAWSDEISEEQYFDMKDSIIQQYPLGHFLLDMPDGSTIFFGKKILNKSIIYLEVKIDIIR